MLFKKIDKRSTCKASKRVLKQYKRLKRIAGEPYSPKVTATFSLEPRSSSAAPGDAMVAAISRKLEAEKELEKIEASFNAIADAYARQILHMLFLEYKDDNEVSNQVIMDRLNYSESEYYRLFERGLMQFAESYDNGSLLVVVK